jgi:hypothetical protein
VIQPKKKLRLKVSPGNPEIDNTKSISEAVKTKFTSFPHHSDIFSGHIYLAANVFGGETSTSVILEIFSDSFSRVLHVFWGFYVISTLIKKTKFVEQQ